MTYTAQDAPAFPFQRSHPFEPPLEYGSLRASGAMTRVRLGDGKQAWLATRFEDVKAVAADHRMSADRSHPGFPSEGGPEGSAFPGGFIFMDPPEHDVLRRMLTGEFSVRRIETMRPEIQRIVNELIDAVIDSPTPVDLVKTFAYPMSTLVICDLLGVPYEDHDFFQSKTQEMVGAASTIPERQAARAAMLSYLDDLVTAKEKDPGDDLIGRLIANRVARGELTHEELVGIGVVLLAAGHETTANMTALGTFALLEHPAELAKFRDEPALVPAAVDELLRYLSIIDSIHRVATDDVEVGGQVIRAGEGVIAVLTAANRDENVFRRASTLNVQREIRHHVAFGHGIHICLGAPLARVELQVALSSLMARIPALRLAVPAAEVPMRYSGPALGPESLPVTW